MSLKDRLTKDLDKIFFNTDEFAEVHTIDGVEMTVIITEVDTEEATMSYGLMKSTLNPKEKQIYRDAWEIYIRKSELTRKVTPNSIIDLDGKKMWVWDVYDTEGMYRLLVGQHAV